MELTVHGFLFMLSNITIVHLPQGRWQLWDGPDGMNGKSDITDYTQKIVWLRPEIRVMYVAQTAYYGEAKVFRTHYPLEWPFNEADNSI